MVFSYASIVRAHYVCSMFRNIYLSKLRQKNLTNTNSDLEI